MDTDTRHLVGRIAALATSIIEQAHELSVQGQSPRITAEEAVETADALKEKAAGIGVLASAMEVTVSARCTGSGLSGLRS